MHPSAPRPYFDYTSDWGDEIWDEYREIQRTWVIQGLGLKEREPRRQRMRIFPNRFENAKHQREFLNARQKVVKRLTEVLQKITSNRKDIELQINCSDALARWYDFQDPTIDTSIDDLLRHSLQKEVADNLEVAQSRSRISGTVV